MPTPYRFKFIHNDPQNPNPKSPLYPTQFGTICEITDSCGAVLSVGITTLAPTDKYSKPLGRKLSAGRAIRSFAGRAYGKATRAYLWEQLFAESPSTRAAKRGA